MLQHERHELLLELLKKSKSASVHELSAALYVSEASVRRDIEHLSGLGLVRRVYGGVMLADASGTVPVSLRDSDHGAVKNELAMRAAELIHDGDTVIFDASSTVRRMLKYLTNRHSITIITNNLRLFEDSDEYDLASRGFKLYSTGGLYLPEDRALAGSSAEAFVETLNANSVFFSSQGITEDGEISDSSEAQTALRRVMLRRAERRYFLCDRSKLGVRRLFKLCTKDELTDIIAEEAMPWQEERS